MAAPLSIGLLNSFSPLAFVFPPAAVVQFQKQGKDMEKVKQRLAEIANYVDKVTIKSTEGTRRGGASDLSEVASSFRRINRLADWVMNGRPIPQLE